MADKDYVNEEREDFIARMLEEGKKVVFPAANELFIDIDSADQLAAFQHLFGILKNQACELQWGADIVYDKPSSSGVPNRHIIISMDHDMTDLERIAWQAALGSDPVRELLSLIRHLRGSTNPTMFVED